MSSGSESDEDYVPEEPAKVSEEESADDETEQQYQIEVENYEHKRKRKPPTKGRKKLKTTTDDKYSNNLKECVEKPTIDPEDEKKKEEDLWAKFLEGTDSKPKPKSQETNSQSIKTVEQVNSSVSKNVKPNTDTEQDRERRIFEFAGETIVVENNVIKEKVTTAEKPAAVFNQGSGPRPRTAAGLSNIVGQLNKKNKLSTLEKSKLDWNTYKKEEGIEEEITSHNKGRDGYLDRQDFLGRTDVRQYEIERNLRMSRRSNR